MPDGNTVTHGPPLETVTVVRAPAAAYGKSSFFKMVVIVFVGVVLSALGAIFFTNNTHSLIPASNDSAVLQWGIGVIIMAFGIVVTAVVAFLVNQADTTFNNINILRSDNIANFKELKADFKEFKADIKASINDFKIDVKESINDVKIDVKESINEVKESINEVKESINKVKADVKESVNEVKTSITATNSRIDNLFESYSLLRAEVASLEGPYWRRRGKDKREKRSRDIASGAEAPGKGA
ncbi:MAG: hypothetical protein LBO66_10905 [Deltaproteobacteria bacterium]|jgi:F0F1-type ATP synthase membrane subunit b/b'|nr:hypothetical protein [Deltaproteobacteria bacterium]